MPFSLLAFPLKDYIQNPFSQIGLTGSAEQSVVENAFGILAHRFRVMITQISLERVEAIILTCFLLHNYLRSQQSSSTVYTRTGS